MDLWTVRRIWKKSITITIIRGAVFPKNVSPCDQGVYSIVIIFNDYLSMCVYVPMRTHVSIALIHFCFNILIVCL